MRWIWVDAERAVDADEIKLLEVIKSPGGDGYWLVMGYHLRGGWCLARCPHYDQAMKVMHNICAAMSISLAPLMS